MATNEDDKVDVKEGAPGNKQKGVKADKKEKAGPPIELGDVTFQVYKQGTSYIIEDGDGNMLQVFHATPNSSTNPQLIAKNWVENSAAHKEAHADSKGNAEDLIEFENSISKAFGGPVTAAMGKGDNWFDKGTEDAKTGLYSSTPEDTALKQLNDEKNAIQEKQRADIKSVLTGLKSQCFFMENIRPFIQHAAGGSKHVSDYQIATQVLEMAQAHVDEHGKFVKQTEEDAFYDAAFAKVEGELGLNTPTEGGFASGYGSKHLCLVSSKRPELLYNALAGDTKNLLAFQKGTPAMFSALVPSIKIFKVFADGQEVQIPFSTHIGSNSSYTNITKMLEDRNGRGDDVGILGFNFDYEQGNIALATNAKTVYAELQLIFESASSFTETRKMKVADGSIRDFKFSDLITEGGQHPKGVETKDSDVYRIRVVAGYGVPPNTAGMPDESSSFFTAARASKIGLFLDTMSYDLDFMETGQMTVTFKYAGAVEEKLDYPEFNIFGMELDSLKKKIDKMKAAARKARQSASGETQSDPPSTGALETPTAATSTPPAGTLMPRDAFTLQADDTIKDMEVQYSGDFMKLYKSFRNSILKRVWRFETNHGALLNYNKTRQMMGKKPTIPAEGSTKLWNTMDSVPTSKMTRANLITGEKKPDEPTPVEGEAAAQVDDPTPQTNSEMSTEGTAMADGYHDDTDATFNPESTYMYWVYFGDILAAMLEQPHIKKELDKNNIRIIVGQAVLVEHMRGDNGEDPAQAISVNLADIPISFKSLNGWFRDNIVKQKRSSMTVLRFVKGITGLLQSTINGRCKTDRSISTRTRQLAVGYHTATKDGKMLDQTGRLVIKGNSFAKYGLSNLTTEGPITKEDRRDYLIIHAHDGGSSEYAGDQEQDAQLGIIHYGLARDRGLLKNCSFKKSEIPYGRELYMAGASADQDTLNTNKLWNVYNADMTLFGNPNIKPYYMSFLDPSMPGMGFLSKVGSTSRALKIGGYYRVIKVSNTITPSSWETQAECMFEKTTFLEEGERDPRMEPEFLS
jgi:hypothetical protein